MEHTQEPEIFIRTVFVGGQTDRQAFIQLIKERRELAKSKLPIDVVPAVGYTVITPRRGIHGGTEEL